MTVSTVSTQNIKISLVLNVKLRGFQEVFIRTQKLNSDLFNYSCVHWVFLFLKKGICVA